MRRNNSLFSSLDWVSICLYIVIVFIGWCTIYAATFDFDKVGFIDLAASEGRQLIWISLSALLALSILIIDCKFYYNISYVFYAIMIFVLIATIFLAPDIKGSHSWLRLGPITLQPAEFAKYATALCLARYMSSYGYSLQDKRNLFTTLAIIFTPVLIIILQSETGSALVFVSFFLVMYRKGMNGLVLFFAFLAAAFFIIILRNNTLPPIDNELCGFIFVFALSIIIALFFINRYLRNSLCIKVLLITNVVIYLVGSFVSYFTDNLISITSVSIISIVVSILILLGYFFYYRKNNYFYIAVFLMASIVLALTVDYAFNNILQPHQQVRIKVVLGLEDDPFGAGYNVRQSQIAIGSGGLTGKGYLNGTQTKLNYVPEQTTDFIFCTIAEEWGFLGTFIFICVYLGFIIRLLFLAERQRSEFSRIFGYSLISILFFHFTINIGMVLGVVPVIGIPLPFISYGGSSLWGFTIMLFTFIRLDANRMEVFR